MYDMLNVLHAASPLGNGYIVRPPRTKISVKAGMVYWVGIDLIPLLSHFNLLLFFCSFSSFWSWLCPGAYSCAGSYLCVVQSRVLNWNSSLLDQLFIARLILNCPSVEIKCCSRGHVLFNRPYTIIIIINSRKYLLYAEKCIHCWVSFINLFCPNPTTKLQEILQTVVVFLIMHMLINSNHL